MIKTAQNSVFIKGAVNGAFYNFADGSVYSVNSEACSVVEKIIQGCVLNENETEYANRLISNGLMEKGFAFHVYSPERVKAKLELCWLELTQKCNCRCIHCYEGGTHIKTPNALDLAEWKNAIDQAAAEGAGRFVIIGGEPTIHPNICEISEYAASKAGTTIFSNGTAVSEELKDVVLRNRIKMKFSLYGHNADVHDRITQVSGSFNKLVETIRFFVREGVEVSAAVVLMKENEAYINDIVLFIRQLGISNFKTDVIRQVFDGTQCEHLPQNRSVIESSLRNKPLFRNVSKAKFDNAFFYNTCWRGKLVICEDGNVLPCVFARRTVLGNIRRSTLSDIIDSNCGQCWELSFDKIDNCKDCEFRFACKDCRPLACASGESCSRNPRCTYDVYSGVWKSE